jgi:hypothetical protein
MTINKGLFAHIIVTLTVIILCLFVVGDESTTMDMRAGIAVAIILANAFCAAFSDIIGLYKQKIKL